MVKDEKRLRQYFEVDYNYCLRCKSLMEFRHIDHKQVLACVSCDFKFWNNPRPVVSRIILIDGSVLLIKRAKDSFKNYWALPGGIIDIGEEPSEAVEREVLEETGITVTADSVFDTYCIRFAPNGPDQQPSYVSIDIVFVMDATKINPSTLSLTPTEEALEIQLYKPTNLPSKIAFGHRNIIHSYFNRL